MQKLQLFELKLDLFDAVKCIRWKLLRSFLSALGIAIGTAALIIMMSISEGAREAAAKKIATLGADTIRIEPVKSSQAENIVTPLSYRDYLLLSNALPKTVIAPYVFTGTQTIRIEGKAQQAQIIEIGHGWLTAEGVAIKSGREFEDSEFSTGTQTCIVGSDLRFVGDSSLGKKISWSKFVCEVSGILQEKGRFLVEESILASLDIDNAVMRPLMGYSETQYGYTGITVKTFRQDIEEIEDIAETVEQSLMRHRQVKDFKVIIPSIMLEKSAEENRTFSIIMGSIASLSLLVGGIGVTNIMLAHIAEQRREIGLRISIGATKKRIASLFFVYSFVICLLGTVAGVFIGIACTLLIQLYFNWDVVFSYFSLSIGPLSALFVGLIFGVYPAFQAAKIPPSEIINNP